MAQHLGLGAWHRRLITKADVFWIPQVVHGAVLQRRGPESNTGVPGPAHLNQLFVPIEMK
jgi:hypothetical protein